MGRHVADLSKPGQAAGARSRVRQEQYFADLAELRRTVYEFLGSLFLYPSEDDIADLVAASVEVRRESDLMADLPFLPRLRVVLDLLEELAEDAGKRLEEEYIDLFVVGASQAPCPPYESAYVDGKGLEKGLVAVEVERAYAASGARLATPGELPDHAALELAFLSVLCAEEAQAWREAHLERARDCLRRERAFHDEHLQRWFPTFARRVSGVAQTSFYRQLAGAARAFVIHDRGLIQALLEGRFV